MPKKERLRLPEPPGVSPWVHHFAVHREPLYVAVIPAVYTVLEDQAATPAHEPDPLPEVDVDVAADVVVVGLVPVDWPILLRMLSHLLSG